MLLHQILCSRAQTGKHLRKHVSLQSRSMWDTCGSVRLDYGENSKLSAKEKDM